jgi:porphobilinogen synthase
MGCGSTCWVFVKEGALEPVPVASMPGVVQHTLESLRKAAVDAVESGVGGLMLFAVPASSAKDAVGSAGTDPGGIRGR